MGYYLHEMVRVRVQRSALNPRLLGLWCMEHHLDDPSIHGTCSAPCDERLVRHNDMQQGQLLFDHLFEATAACISDYQRYFSLPASGECDPATSHAP